MCVKLWRGFFFCLLLGEVSCTHSQLVSFSIDDIVIIIIIIAWA